jgi:valyl-tRNA synthetase
MHLCVMQVWKWKEAHGGRINAQLLRLGAGLDWRREARMGMA